MRHLQSALLAAVAAFGFASIASAADMPVKARPMMTPVYNWTGCYVGAGGGYGMFNVDNQTVTDPGGVVLDHGTFGGRGFFGTGQVGCDYQFLPKWVAGAFADFDFGSLKGNVSSLTFSGEAKERSSWAAGARAGYLPWDTLLTFVSAGFTQLRSAQIDLNVGGVPTPFSSPASTFGGWFLGSGYEYKLDWLPGLTWKTEYRFADYGNKNIPIVVTATGAPVGIATNSHLYVQTIRTELVYRFNWH